jgi:hypothetical protein
MSDTEFDLVATLTALRDDGAGLVTHYTERELPSLGAEPDPANEEAVAWRKIAEARRLELIDWAAREWIGEVDRALRLEQDDDSQVARFDTTPPKFEDLPGLADDVQRRVARLGKIISGLASRRTASK